MTKFIGDDVTVTVDGVDLTDHVKSVDVKDAFPQVNLTGMGSSAQEMALAKAKTSTIDVEFFQDYAASKVAVTLEPLVGSNTPFTVTVVPNGAASVSANNQKYSMVSLLPEWDYVQAGGVGEASIPKASFICGDSTGISKSSS